MSFYDDVVMQATRGWAGIREAYKLNPPAMTALRGLVTFDGEAGCFPRQEELADRIGMPVRNTRRALQRLEDGGLIESYKQPYVDRYGRERKGKIDHYRLSEALEIAIASAHDRYESTPQQEILGAQIPAKMAGNGAQIAAILAADGAADGSEEGRASSGQNGRQARADSGHSGRQRRASSGHYGRSEVGGKAGRKDIYLQTLEDPAYLPRLPQPGPDDRELALRIMSHQDICLPSHFQDAVAAKFPSVHVFELCAVWRADFEAGRVDGVGALMHRFANAPDAPPRTLGLREEKTRFYRDMYAVVPAYEGRWPGSSGSW